MARRYGLSDKRMFRTLSQMSADARDRKIGMTVPVVGSVLSGRRADFLKSISHDRFEIAVHGYSHDDFSSLEVERLREDISKAKATFEGFGFRPLGYRSPYLRPKDGLSRLLSEYGFSFSSSKAAASDRSAASNRAVLEVSDAIAREIYGPQISDPRSVSLRQENRVIEIPVSLPDDEILIDRMGIREEGALEGILADIIGASLKSDSFAVIQIHPERYPFFRNALLSIADRMMREGVRFITLGELSRGLQSQSRSPHASVDGKSVCVTGDLDIMSLRDLLR
jgi:peptidoglycan/xylan/chitin deacetylase (PgdA/CDA1 family)